MNPSPHTIIDIELSQNQNPLKTPKPKLIKCCKTLSALLFCLASILTLIIFTLIHWQAWTAIRTMRNTCLHTSWDNTNYINSFMMLTFTTVPVFIGFLLVVYHAMKSKLNYFRSANRIVNYVVPDCESFPEDLRWTVKINIKNNNFVHKFDVVGRRYHFSHSYNGDEKRTSVYIGFRH